ncbi:polysaccharide biosynthesis/export family protein [Telmatocola sphagniphila]|jgi:polysaccharide export outer membrane protein|uniref:Polysaccharide biosynthesis/export family protein n=1 Tax=Telmatocola sphagniphila TaxID=1123043 RepID=A0A8E6B9Z4_9BACT|nr:polysaccharide biosynthesis/export family protein [Telmatocola sphagniphila]QVL34471.1 polysaccharide biosynthesis/export family protein [Telmatocola sphagniphila]
MTSNGRWRFAMACGFYLAIALANTGCLSTSSQKNVFDPYVVTKAHHGDPQPYNGNLPRELDMVTMPEYQIEPPDILRIDAIRVLPQLPYKVEPLDGLFIQVANSNPEEPINTVYIVEPDGSVNLGPSYGGPIKLQGMTLPEAKEAIEKHLKTIVKLKDPKAVVSLSQSRVLQQIRGEHLVQPDGTVNLGTYGNVRVVGLTVTQARQVIEQHLGKYLQSPEIAVSVAAFNSKTFYVIYDGANRGQQVVRLPVTGKDTVLDAVSQLYGLSPVSSTNSIWIARPSPTSVNEELILPVDWMGITTKGKVATNYQLLPGDRLFVKANPWITFDNKLAQVLAPFERIFGFTLLGNGAVRAVDGQTNVSGGF